MTWEIRPRSELAGLSAICAGAGPQVVLIHGVGLRAEAWNRQIDALSPEFHVTAVDVPGHGESHLSDDNPGLSDYTDGIAAVLDGPALVIGHSMGAMIALDMAVRFPDRVRGVAALNAVFDRSNAASKAVQVRAEGLDGASRADPSEPLDRWFGAVSSPQRDACRKWLCDVDPVTYRAAYRVFARENGPGREELVTLACPALFATGSEEPNSTPAMSREMATLARYGQSAIVNGAAHMMQMTHPDEVNSVLLTFAQNVMR